MLSRRPSGYAHARHRGGAHRAPPSPFVPCAVAGPEDAGPVTVAQQSDCATRDATRKRTAEPSVSDARVLMIALRPPAPRRAVGDLRIAQPRRTYMLDSAGQEVGQHGRRAQRVDRAGFVGSVPCGRVGVGVAERIGTLSHGSRAGHQRSSNCGLKSRNRSVSIVRAMRSEVSGIGCPADCGARRTHGWVPPSRLRVQVANGTPAPSGAVR